MALLVPDAGEVKLLEMLLKDTVVYELNLHLYINDKTPTETDILTNYTEMNSQGYAAMAINRAGWTIATDAGSTIASHSQKEFLFNGTGGDTTVHGYYITIMDGETRKLLWAEKFPYPQVIRSSGDSIKIVPRMQLD